MQVLSLASDAGSIAIGGVRGWCSAVNQVFEFVTAPSRHVDWKMEEVAVGLVHDAVQKSRRRRTPVT